MEELIVFAIGAAGYSLIEIVWRGYTHWTMAVLGGLCFSFIYGINCTFSLGFMAKCLVGAGIITALELIFGAVVNLGLGWNVWDYSQLPFNFKGQICLLYSLLWFLLCIPTVKLCDVLKITMDKII